MDMSAHFHTKLPILKKKLSFECELKPIVFHFFCIVHETVRVVFKCQCKTKNDYIFVNYLERCLLPWTRYRELHHLEPGMQSNNAFDYIFLITKK